MELKDKVQDVMDYLAVLKSTVRAGVEVIHPDLTIVNGEELAEDDRQFITENFNRQADTRLSNLSGYLMRKSTRAYEQLDKNIKTTAERRSTL